MEQQLINTRDRLDSELELYKKLHDFNSKALSQQTTEDFFQLITEAIVDLFEVECAIVYFEKTNSADQNKIYSEGLKTEKTAEISKKIISDLKSIANQSKEHLDFGVSAKEFKHLDFLSWYAEGLFFCFTDS